MPTSPLGAVARGPGMTSRTRNFRVKLTFVKTTAERTVGRWSTSLEVRVTYRTVTTVVDPPSPQPVLGPHGGVLAPQKFWGGDAEPGRAEHPGRRVHDRLQHAQSAAEPRTTTPSRAMAGAAGVLQLRDRAARRQRRGLDLRPGVLRCVVPTGTGENWNTVAERTAHRPESAVYTLQTRAATIDADHGPVTVSSGNTSALYDRHDTSYELISNGGSPATTTTTAVVRPTCGNPSSDYDVTSGELHARLRGAVGPARLRPDRPANATTSRIYKPARRPSMGRRPDRHRRPERVRDLREVERRSASSPGSTALVRWSRTSRCRATRPRSSTSPSSTPSMPASGSTSTCGTRVTRLPLPAVLRILADGDGARCSGFDYSDFRGRPDGNAANFQCGPTTSRRSAHHRRAPAAAASSTAAGCRSASQLPNDYSAPHPSMTLSPSRAGGGSATRCPGQRCQHRPDHLGGQRPGQPGPPRPAVTTAAAPPAAGRRGSRASRAPA